MGIGKESPFSMRRRGLRAEYALSKGRQGSRHSISSSIESRSAVGRGSLAERSIVEGHGQGLSRRKRRTTGPSRPLFLPLHLRECEIRMDDN